jgi:hypothetical protein
VDLRAICQQFLRSIRVGARKMEGEVGSHEIVEPVVHMVFCLFERDMEKKVNA